MPSPLVSTLKQIKVVGSGKCEDVLRGMPRRMKYLLIKVEAVDAYLVFATLAGRADAPRPQRLHRRLGSIGSYG